ncbi:MAG: hypothetical protein WCO56_04515 [Verrucomicrobiota bacterium]
MKDQDTRDRFVQLRAQGWSYNRIATELNVCKKTLITWSRQLQFEIHNLQVMEAEALREQHFLSYQDRCQLLSDRLRRIRAALDQRDFNELPTASLLALESRLRTEVNRESTPVQLVTPFKDIPAPELPSDLHQWSV